MKEKFKHVLFWFKSNKGSDFKRVFKLKAEVSTKEINGLCEEWAENIINNGPYSESMIHYGWKRVTMPATRAELVRKHRAAYDTFARARERCDVLAAMLNPQELP